MQDKCLWKNLEKINPVQPRKICMSSIFTLITTLNESGSVVFVYFIFASKLGSNI